MIYEACFDSRRGCEMDVNCSFFFCKDCWRWEQRWKLEMKVGDRIYLMAGGVFFSLFRVWVWVWSFMHQMSELRVEFLFLGLVDHHSRPRCIFERGWGVNFL